jgi:D-alanyl-D-alanine carboxypeptidase
MIKKIWIFLFAVLVSSFLQGQSLADSMLVFFKNHPKTTAVYAIKNNTILAGYNETKVLPLATMSDLLVAMEFSKQAAYKIIDTAERVSLKELVKYYFEDTKIDNYELWLSTMLMQKKVNNNTVSLLDVVHGMLQFGVLANTEYLMDKLGFDNIKSSIQSYNLTDHEAVMPPVGALALYQNRVHTNEKKILKAIDQMDEQAYCKAAFIMHTAIKNDSTFKTKSVLKIKNNALLQMWSERLPQASVKTYANLLQTVLKEKMLDPVYYRMLRVVLEWPMQYAEVSKLFDRFSRKGSVTNTVFSQAQYGIVKGNGEMVLVYTCVDLKPQEMQQVTRWYPDFELKAFTDKAFQAKLTGLSVIKK